VCHACGREPRGSHLRDTGRGRPRLRERGSCERCRIRGFAWRGLHTTAREIGLRCVTTVFAPTPPWRVDSPDQRVPPPPRRRARGARWAAVPLRRCSRSRPPVWLSRWWAAARSTRARERSVRSVCVSRMQALRRWPRGRRARATRRRDEDRRKTATRRVQSTGDPSRRTRNARQGRRIAQHARHDGQNRPTVLSNSKES